ncbi:MAG TPA: YraN family protein [Gudongella oleilytica]|nr:YraN family protein [Gudongella oleilytica]
MNRHINTGRMGESLAIEYLTDKGYVILETNYRNKIGEVDIIAYYKNVLVFVEVKTRLGTNYGYAFESVDSRKQKKIANTSLMYLQKNRMSDVQVRYDVIEVYPMEEERVNHFENAFSL